MSPETINAIANLWKPITALAFLLAIIFFRVPLQEVVTRFLRARFKKGDTELSFETFEKSNQAELSPQNSVGLDTVIEAQQKTTQEISKPADSGDWFMKMWNAIEEKNLSQAEEAFKNLQSSEIDANQKLANESLYYYLQYSKGNDKSAISRLEKLTEKHEAKSIAYFWLSACYEFDNAFDKAISILRKSVDAAITNEGRADRTKVLIDLLIKSESPIEESFKILSDAIKTLPRENLAPIYLAYSNLYNKQNNKLLKAIALEKAIELEIGETNEIFNAAYVQSEIDIVALAIINYEAVIRKTPENAGALNNLGVVYDKLNMPIKAVEKFLESSKKNETLAMANLAYRYINQGLIEEANNILEKAQEQADIHPNVIEALASISKQTLSENEKHREIEKLGIRQKNFIRGYGEARFLQENQIGKFNGDWTLESESILVEEKDQKFITTWGKSPNKRRIHGEIAGKSAIFTIEKQREWITSSESYSKDEEGLCYLDSNNQTIYFMTLSKEKSRFFEITR